MTIEADGSVAIITPRLIKLSELRAKWAIAQQKANQFEAAINVVFGSRLFGLKEFKA